MTPREFISTPLFRHVMIICGLIYIIYAITKKSRDRDDYHSIAVLSILIVIVAGFEYSQTFTSFIVGLFTSNLWIGLISIVGLTWSAWHLLRWNELDPILKARAIKAGIGGLVLIIVQIMMYFN